MAVELDFEQHAFLREMDSPTNSFRTPSPRQTLQNNETTRYVKGVIEYSRSIVCLTMYFRNPQSRLALASKRYSIADTYETAAARDVTTSQRSLFDRQQLRTKRDFALPNSEVNDQTTNKLHRAYTVSNPKYSDQRLHKRSNSNLLPRTVYKSRTDEKLQLENSRPDAHPQVLNSLDSARHEEKVPEVLFKINSRGVARPTQFKEPSTHSRSSSVQVNTNSYNPDMEPYAPRYSTSRIRESFHGSTAKTTEPVKKPQVTFNLEKGLYERNQEESDSPSTRSKQPSIARRWSTIEHSYDIKSDKALPQYRRSILGDKPRASSIIRPTALQSPTSAEFSNHQDLPSPRYRSRAAELASNADKNYEETYEELSKRLRSASIGSEMSQFSQKKQVQPTQSKSAEVLARRSKSIFAATPRTSGRDRTVSLPDDTPVEEKRDKSAQKSYLQSIKSGSSSLRLPQRSKMSRSLLPDFIGSSMLDITKEEEPMQRSADWSLRWPDEMLRRAKEEELQMSNHDHDAVLRHSYSRVSPSTTASSSSASNVSGDFSSRTATSKTRSTSTSIESLGRFSTIPESKFGVENGPSNRQSGAKYDIDDQSRRNQHAPSPTFSMYSEKPWITDRTGHYADEMYNQLGSMELAESEYLESNYPQARHRRHGMEEYGQSTNQMVMQKRSYRYSSPASMVRTPNYKTQVGFGDALAC